MSRYNRRQNASELLPPGIHDTSLEATRNNLIPQARAGDLQAIERLGSLACETLLPTHVISLALVVFTGKTYDVEIDAPGHSDRRQSDIISDAVFTALRYIYRIFKEQSFWSKGTWMHVREMLDALVMLKVFDANFFWDWYRSYVSRCLVVPQSHTEILHMVDTVFGSFIFHDSCPWHGKLENMDVLRVCARAWVRDTEWDGISISLQNLVAEGVFHIEQLMSVVRCSLEDLANICLDHLRIFQVRCATNLNVSGREIVGLGKILFELLKQHELAKVHLAVNNGMSPLIDVILFLVDRAEQDLRRYKPLSIPETVTILAHLVRVTTDVAGHGPEYLIYVVDRSFLNTILRLGTFWILRYRVWRAPQDFDTDDLKDLSRAAEDFLKLTEQHLYHRRAFRHIIGANEGYKLKLIPDGFEQSVPFSKSWHRLLDNIVKAKLIYNQYKPDRSQLCNNPQCPHKGSSRAVHKLRECSRCHIQVVCSRECQRVAWTNHREQCDQVVATVNRISHHQGMPGIPDDVVSYFQHVISFFAKGFARDFGLMFKQRAQENIIEFCKNTPSNQPNHVINIKIGRDPVALFVYPISSLEGQHMRYGLDSCLETLRTENPPDMLIVCSNFVVGQVPIAVSCLFTFIESNQ